MRRKTYLQILIRSLLVLLVHRTWRWARKLPDGNEDRETDSNSRGRVKSNFHALAGGCDGAGAVFAEGNVVC